MKTSRVRPMIRRPPIMRSRLGHTRRGLSYLVEFIVVCTLLIFGAAVAEVYLVAPPSVESSTTMSSHSTSQNSNSLISHSQYSSSVEVECLPGRTVVSAQVVCTATVTLSGSGGTAMIPSGQADFTSNGKGTFKSPSCNVRAGSLVCTETYSPNPGTEGTQIVVATYPGDGVVTSSSASFSLTATKRNSSLIVSCSPSQLPGGASASCGATLNDTSGSGSSTPTGQVNFLSNVTGSFSSPSCALVSGYCAVSFTPGPESQGSALVTASYGGDADHIPSSGLFSIVYGKIGTSVSVQCSPSKLSPNQLVNCQVKVSDSSSETLAVPTGSVTFSTSSQGNFSSTTCTLVAGSCSFRYEAKPGSEGTAVLGATYQGDSQHSSSSTSRGGSFTLVIIPRSSATTVTCSPQTLPVSFGTTCTATVADTGSGQAIALTKNVTFSSAASGKFNETQCALRSGSCSVKFTPGSGSEGSVNIRANYTGDLDHTASSGTFQIAATVRSTAVSITCTNAAAGSPSTCTITVADSDRGVPIIPTGTVDRFYDGGWGGSFGSVSCSLNVGSCTVTYIPSGGTSGIGITITATYEGDSDHASSKGSTVITPS